VGEYTAYTEKKPKLPPNLAHQHKGDLHLLIHPEKPYWLVVNDTAWEIVKLCDGKNDVKDISSSLATKYRKDPSITIKDTHTYLSQLSKAKFFSSEGIVNKSNNKSSLKRLHLNITDNCNLSCIHCGVLPNGKRQQLEKDRVIGIIDELSNYSTARLAISGGEPLLHKDCLDIVSLGSQKARTSLSTNATCIDENIARKLSMLDIDIQISLDGFNGNVNDAMRGTGNFDKTLRGLQLLGRYNCTGKIILFVTVTKANIATIPELLNLAEHMQIPSVRFLPVQKVGNARVAWNDITPTPHEYRQLYSYLYKEISHRTIDISTGFQGFLLESGENKRWCSLGETLFISSNGNIYPCSLMAHEDFFIGSINEMTLKDALESPKLLELVSMCSSRELAVKKCRRCTWKHFCQASCPGSVFFQKGTLMDTDDLCSIREELYPNVIFTIADNSRASSMMPFGGCEV
jgi:radical SAM protein with 4Fe4S-binding SPASM domain